MPPFSRVRSRDPVVPSLSLVACPSAACVQNQRLRRPCPTYSRPRLINSSRGSGLRANPQRPGLLRRPRLVSLYNFLEFLQLAKSLYTVSTGSFWTKSPTTRSVYSEHGSVFNIPPVPERPPPLPEVMPIMGTPTLKLTASSSNPNLVSSRRRPSTETTSEPGIALRRPSTSTLHEDQDPFPSTATAPEWSGHKKTASFSRATVCASRPACHSCACADSRRAGRCTPPLVTHCRLIHSSRHLQQSRPRLLPSWVVTIQAFLPEATSASMPVSTPRTPFSRT